MTTTVDLLDALCAHLTEFELPTIASVHVAAAIPAPQVTVQLACHQPPEIARALLTWADTLTRVTAEAWRVPCGDSVHLSVMGLLPSGASVQVYGGMRFIQEGFGADLGPAATTIPLAALRHLAALREATA